MSLPFPPVVYTDCFQQMNPAVTSIVASFSNRLFSGQELYLTGGCLVDAILAKETGRAWPNRDVDCIIVGLTDNDQLEKLFWQFRPVQNRYGGLKIVHPKTGMNVDLWRLENHNWWWQPRPTTISEALDISTLSINAIAWCPRQGILIDRGFANTLRTKTLELNVQVDQDNPLSGLGDLHILMCACKFQKVLRMGPRLTARLRSVLRQPSAQATLATVESKMKEKRLSEREIREYRAFIKRWSP